jgi:dihydroorotate dehydrogenase (fumarate)
MLDLTTKYMGMTLKNPIIIGSSGLTHSVEDLKKLEANGAAAVVLKSIFEEQIEMEANSLEGDHLAHTEAEDYIRNYTRQHNLSEYLKLISDAKKELSIPVIASINCVTASEWVSFAGKIQDAGADALELNIFIMPSNYQQKGEDIEQVYFDIIQQVREQVTIPLAVKIGCFFSGLANMIFNLSVRKINGLVLFNRFFRPDIDIEKRQIIAADVFSSPAEHCLPLRWIGMMAGHAKCDLVASTGIHDGETVIKNLMAGAKAVQVATVIYKEGAEHIGVMLEQIKKWMKANNQTKLSGIIGSLSHKHIKDPVKYERAQFMKYFAGAKL